MHACVKFMLSLLLLPALAACSSGGTLAPTSPPASLTGSAINLNMTDNGRTIKVRVGDEIDVTLQTIGPGAYATPQVNSAAIRFLATSDVTPVVPAGPTQVFRFEAAAPGQTTITIQGAGQNPTFTVTLQIS